MYRLSLLFRVWKYFIPIKPSIGRARKHEIFQGSFEAHTYRPTIDFAIGLVRKLDSKYSDDSLIGDVLTKYDLNPSSEIIFTDGSYNPACCATGASLVLENQKIAYKVSLHRYCSSFTAKVFAVKAALKLMVLQRDSRDGHIVIMSDCKSALSAISNNLLNVHKNRYATEAKLLYTAYFCT